VFLAGRRQVNGLDHEGSGAPKIAVDRDYLLEFAQQLVRIDSVNPSVEPGGAGESALAAYLAARLADLGLEVGSYEASPGRVSVIARLPGAGGGRSLMLNGHLDTVGIVGMPYPFSGAVRDGRLYGRGSYDMKGSVAACVAAIKTIQDAGIALAGDLILAAVADEEHASLGTTDVISRLTVDGAVVTEPTGLRLCRAHKGFVWVEIETFGRAAHGSRYDLGIDANMAMGRVLGRLSLLEASLRAGSPHPLTGPPSLHAATIRGGTGLSTYAASCVLRVERRTVPGESAEDAVSEIRQILAELGDADPGFRAEVRVLMAREPWETPAEGVLARAVEHSAHHVLKRPPEHAGESFWMDAALLAAAGVETMVIGPTGAGAHAEEEWVEIRSLELLAEILVRTAMEYCGLARES
jgi:acetylornithine deacetylase